MATTAKKTGSKKVKRNVPNGVVHIQSTFNNTIVSISDTSGQVISWSSAATITSPILAFSALLKTWEMIEMPLIFNKGLPGSREADNLDGIITNVFIDFLYLI